MDVDNRDIFPAQHLVDIYGLVKPLLVNPIIDQAFQARERTAVTAKTGYHRQGRLGMILVLISMLITLASASALPLFPNFESRFEVLSFAAIGFGALGLFLQIHLILTRRKQTWLLNRFAAERLRSIKFQAYVLAEVASPSDLQHRVDAFLIAEIAKLESELNTGAAALRLFSARAATVKASPKGTGIEAQSDIAAAAQAAYHELRINYQKRFAAGEVEAVNTAQRITVTAADLLYLAGAMLIIGGLVTKLLLPEAKALPHWIDFFGLSAFVVGLLKTIMDNASLAETSRARYEDYIQEIQECETELAEELADFPSMVRRIERVVLAELGQFCQEASRISYRL